MVTKFIGTDIIQKELDVYLAILYGKNNLYLCTYSLYVLWTVYIAIDTTVNETLSAIFIPVSIILFSLMSHILPVSNLQSKSESIRNPKKEIAEAASKSCALSFNQLFEQSLQKLRCEHRQTMQVLDEILHREQCFKTYDDGSHKEAYLDDLDEAYKALDLYYSKNTDRRKIKLVFQLETFHK